MAWVDQHGLVLRTSLRAFSGDCAPCNAVLYGPQWCGHDLQPCMSPMRHVIIRALCRLQGSTLALTWLLTVATGVVPEYALSFHPLPNGRASGSLWRASRHGLVLLLAGFMVSLGAWFLLS
ncbi:hypothetical protein BHE74_00031613 [Ensete ventricosum]|nr:hypothetical protein BHE74_00031613 [Ensete ventricosum]RZS16485.1 hypothetical protein BHM03_00048472 [Ensete ventricosum]